MFVFTLFRSENDFLSLSIIAFSPSRSHFLGS